MAVFTSHRQFTEGRVFIEADLPHNRIGPAAVAHNAAPQNRPGKTPVLNFKSWSKAPRMRLGVIAKRSFEQIMVPLNQEAETVSSRANAIADSPSLPEELFAVGIQSILAL